MTLSPPRIDLRTRTDYHYLYPSEGGYLLVIINGHNYLRNVRRITRLSDIHCVVQSHINGRVVRAETDKREQVD